MRERGAWLGRVLAVFLLALPVAARAQFTYTTNNGAITITGYSGSGGSVVIPQTINGHPVKSIGDSAFYQAQNVTGVNIPNSVTNIGGNAFHDCPKLSSVTISTNVTTIADYSFASCISLTNITLPFGVVGIGDFAFGACAKLCDLQIPGSVTSVGTGAFTLCDSLTNVIVPTSVTNLGDYAFGYCAHLTKVIILAHISSIGDYEFSGCTNLAVVSIPNSVNDIRDGAFFQCTNLTDITIPDGVTNLGAYALSWCTKLTAIVIPSSVDSIGDHAFYSSTNLAAVEFIGDAPSLVGLLIFESAPEVIVYYQAGTSGWGATFAGAPTALWVPPPPFPFTYTNINGSITITGYTGSNGVVTVPDWIDGCPVTSIGAYAFEFGGYGYGSSGFSSVILTNITLGTNINNIGPGAFELDDSLGSIVIPNQVTNIGAYAFTYCFGLTNVTIGTNVVSIGNNAFFSCTSLTNVLIPKSATNIGVEAFDQCANLAAINLDAQNPYYSSTNGLLFNKQKTSLIEAPGAIAGNYVVPDGVTNIAAGAFLNCTNLGGITISNRSVISIGTNAFGFCWGLTNVLMGSNVVSISASAFQSCSGLTNVDVPHGVVRLGAGVFNNCSSLAIISLHSSLTNISPGWGYFSFGAGFPTTNMVQLAGNCPNLTAFTVVAQNLYYSATNGVLFNKPLTVLLEAPGGITGNYVVPNTVTNIGDNAFTGCTNLTGLKIPTSVKRIGAGAFAGCSGLTNAVIGTNVTSIEADAFYICSSLRAVAIPANVTNIGYGAFASCTSLTNITVDVKNAYYSSSNGFLFDKHFTSLIQVPGAFAGNYTIPNSVTNIGYTAFFGCGNLDNVTLGTNVTSIGSSAFAGCYNLKSLFFKGNAPSVITYTNYSGIGLPGMPFPRILIPPPLGGPGFVYPVYPPVVYYLPGAQGWGATFLNMPVAPWDLQVQTGGGSLGVRTNQFGFNITGSSNVIIVVEACTNLFKPDWQPVETNALNNGSMYFSDPQWTNYPGRFYRFRSE